MTWKLPVGLTLANVLAPSVILLQMQVSWAQTTPGVLGGAAPEIVDQKGKVPCPVSRPNVEQAPSYYGNDVLWVGLPPDGTYVFKPGGPGSVSTRDGALGIKAAWKLLVPGQLRIEGRRLDGKSAPLRSWVSTQLGPTNIQPASLVFPEPGCWEITGRIGTGSLTYMVNVLKVGDGPSASEDF